MIRNIKALSLAMVAMLAMSALVTSAAPAKEITTQRFKAQDGTYPETFHGTNPITKETFTTEAGTVECDSTFSGSISEPTTTVKVSANYTNCRAFGFLSASVNMTSCHYTFHLTTEVETDWYQAHADLTCTTANDHVDIVASTCELQIDPQEGLTTINITNMTGTTHSITVKAAVTGINYTVTKDGFGCPFSGTGSKTGAEYKAHEYVEVTSPGGILIG